MLYWYTELKYRNNPTDNTHLKGLHSHGEPTQMILIILADYTSFQDHMGM